MDQFWLILAISLPLLAVGFGSMNQVPSSLRIICRAVSCSSGGEWGGHLPPHTKIWQWYRTKHFKNPHCFHKSLENLADKTTFLPSITEKKSSISFFNSNPEMSYASASGSIGQDLVLSVELHLGLIPYPLTLDP